MLISKYLMELVEPFMQMRFKKENLRIMSYMASEEEYSLMASTILDGSKMVTHMVTVNSCFQMEATRKVRCVMDNTLI